MYPIHNRDIRWLMCPIGNVPFLDRSSMPLFLRRLRLVVRPHAFFGVTYRHMTGVQLHSGRRRAKIRESGREPFSRKTSPYFFQNLIVKTVSLNPRTKWKLIKLGEASICSLSHFQSREKIFLWVNTLAAFEKDSDSEILKTAFNYFSPPIIDFSVKDFSALIFCAQISHHRMFGI
jgi:hypothetical protein